MTTEVTVYPHTQRVDPLPTIKNGEPLMPRQKRFERAKAPANILLDSQPHYFQVVEWLLRLRFMTTEQIGRVLDPPRKPSSVHALLRRMFDAGLITRLDVSVKEVKKHWGAAQAYGAVTAVHCLDRKGRDFLAGRLEVDSIEVDWKPRDNQKTGPLAHRLATNDILITMYLGAKKLGWTFEIVQTERDIHTKEGHDFVTDPETHERKPVKADAVARLTQTPSKKAAWLSPEVDMGTEAEKKIRQKIRLHREHYVSGDYQKRHGVKSNRTCFVVADVRDPYLIRPIDQAEWKERVRQRTLTLKHWAEAEGMGSQFWFTPGFALTEEAVWQGPIWARPGQPTPVSFV